MGLRIIYFATSGGHYGELIEWCGDIEAVEEKFIIDGPNVASDDKVVNIPKIDNVLDALRSVKLVKVQLSVSEFNIIISCGAQNALTARVLAWLYRKKYYYVESFQRTDNLSRAGMFSIFCASKIFLFHPINTKKLPFGKVLWRFYDKKIYCIENPLKELK